MRFTIKKISHSASSFAAIAMLGALVVQGAAAQRTPATVTDVRVEVRTRTEGDIRSEQIVAALIPRVKISSDVPRQEIIQSNAQFRPFISVAQTGSRLSFPNRDEFAHHVYSFSKALSFELPLYSGDQEHALKLTNSGVVPLGCNIHDWMLGFLFVVDTPYYTFLNANVASFDEIPAGDYVLSLWHPSMPQSWEHPVSVADGEPNIVVTLPSLLTDVSPMPTPRNDNFEEDY